VYRTVQYCTEKYFFVCSGPSGSQSTTKSSTYRKETKSAVQEMEAVKLITSATLGSKHGESVKPLDRKA
jgi:hypothetical protein